jgi:hypothetical protein
MIQTLACARVGNLQCTALGRMMMMCHLSADEFGDAAGPLEDRVKAGVLKLIDSGVALTRSTQRTVAARDAKRRQHVLAKLRDQLCSPQPAPKKIRNSSGVLRETVAKLVEYPFVPQSTAGLEPRQFWSIPLDNGRFACSAVQLANKLCRVLETLQRPRRPDKLDSDPRHFGVDVMQFSVL